MRAIKSSLWTDCGQTLLQNRPVSLGIYIYIDFLDISSCMHPFAEVEFQYLLLAQDLALWLCIPLLLIALSCHASTTCDSTGASAEACNP